ncbi:MAG TPA: hypothetical protein VEX60_07140 [Pyrinomonadaceae bacterium]|nr:hypothetical protein [Pyrinomonadaceae bacterium]
MLRREIPAAGISREKGRVADSFAFDTSARPSSYHTFGKGSPRAEALTVDERRQQILIPATAGTPARWLWRLSVFLALISWSAFAAETESDFPRGAKSLEAKYE